MQDAVQTAPLGLDAGGQRSEVARLVDVELEPCGVRVNLVSAGAAAGDAVVDAVCLLLSDRSGALTGEVVYADGE